MKLPAAAFLVLTASFSAAGEQGLVSNGIEAEQALGQGLGPKASLGDAHAGGVMAEQLLQGARGRSDAVRAGGASGGPAGESGVPGPQAGFQSRETPPPAIGAPLEPAEEGPAKKKRNWGKLIATWLPIGIFYYSSAMAIINPLGAAAGFARGMAGIALLGTVLMLYREAKRK